MSNLIIVEGETEEKFFKIYKHLLNKQSLIKRCNLFLNTKKNNAIFGEKYDNVYIILDADIFNSANWSIFRENYKKVVTTKNSNKFVFIQNKNFEDELSYALGIKNKNNLYKLFSALGEKEFKSNFINNDCKNKLEKLDFNKLYIRFKECKGQIPKDIKLSIHDNRKIFKIK